ncbi:MAG: hypothetical protein J7M15_01530 [Anaerolineae bacterium]|nr:hypothetical protein [Anaerolineae bacterium]
MREIAQYALHIPHSSEQQMVVTWIASHAAWFAVAKTRRLSWARQRDG